MSAREATPSRCPRCGAELPPDTPGGICPGCALASALESTADEHDSQFLSLHDIPPPGKKIAYLGDYELLEVIARGGMGVVYKARQRSLNRCVAVKLMLGGAHASEDYRRRFRQEAEMAARLQHLNIVPIYEVGEHEGQPYFSMEFVDGADFAHLTRERPFSPRLAAEHVRAVAEAIHFAHRQGVLHRDLKPSNVLLGSDGRVRITDFGLAREVDAQSSLTMSGEMLGTPGYLPPEQVSVTHGAISAASDVYALGSVLYHLLSGRPPFVARTVPEVLRLVLESPAPGLRKSRPEISSDLETICLKCLEKEPERRYASAQMLADDLGHFLRSEPIVARPVGSVGRLWRWSRRKPVTAALLCALALVGAMSGFGIWQYRGKLQQAGLRDSVEAQKMFQAVQSFLDSQQFAAACALLADELRRNPADRVAAERLLNALASRAVLVPQSIYSDPLVQSGTWFENGRTVLIAGAGRAEAEAKGAAEDSQTANKGSLTRLEVETGVATPLEVGGPVSAIAVAADGRFAAAESSGCVRVWLKPEAPAALVLRQNPEALLQLGFLSENKLLGVSEHRVGHWSIPQGEFTPWQVAAGTELVSGTWNLTAQRVAVADIVGNIHLWETSSARWLRTITNSDQQIIRSLAFNPDGSRLVSVGATSEKTNASIYLWDAATGSRMQGRSEKASPFLVAQFSPDDQWLATSSLDGEVRLWSSEDTMAPLRVLPSEARSQRRPINSLAFSPDGTQLATAGDDQTLRVWETASGTLAAEVAQFEHPVLHVAFSTDGQRILACVEKEGAVILSRAGPQSRPFQIKEPASGMSALAKAEKSKFEKVHRNSTTFADLSPDGSLLATASEDGTALIWNRRTDQPLVTLKHPDQARVNCVRFSHDGRRLATSTSERMFRVWDVATGLPLTDWITSPLPVSEVRFSADDRAVVFAESLAWPIHLVQQPVPSWLPDLAEALGDLRVPTDGEKTGVPRPKFFEARAKLKLAKPIEPWVKWLQNYFQCETAADK